MKTLNRKAAVELFMLVQAAIIRNNGLEISKGKSRLHIEIKFSRVRSMSGLPSRVMEFSVLESFKMRKRTLAGMRRTG